MSSLEDEFWLILQTTSDSNKSEIYNKKIMADLCGLEDLKPFIYI
jgi:hypothetical protein